MSAPYTTEKQLNKLCDFLKASDDLKVREAVMREKRVLYFKGEKLVTFLSEQGAGTSRKKKWPKGLPKLADRTDAVNVCKTLMSSNYILRAEKMGKGTLNVSRDKEFAEDGYYAWLYEGDPSRTYMMTGVLIVAFLACTCFPIWPQFLKVWIWYLSCTLLIVIFGLCLVRLTVFVIFWIVGYDFWILPNLFDESLGVAESFSPLWSFCKSGEMLLFRLAVAGGIASFFYWAATQPTEFDGMIKAQRSFLDDLYSGNLLTDMSQQAKDDIDKPKVKSLDDLLLELDAVDVEEETKTEAILDQLLNEEDEGVEGGEE